MRSRPIQKLIHFKKTNNLERALRIEQLNKSFAQTKATIFGSSESDESNKQKKTKTVHKNQRKKPLVLRNLNHLIHHQLVQNKVQSQNILSKNSLNNVGKEVNKSSTRKKKDTYGKKNYESSALKSKEKNVLLKSGGKVKGTSLDQLDFNQKNIYADNYESRSTVGQTLPVPRSLFLSDASNLTCEQLPLDFAMDAFVDANGVLVFPDAADPEKTSVHSIINTFHNNIVKEKSDADRGVFLSQDHKFYFHSMII
ncbi:uncharacterized protein LOC141533809 [Cotesia typhae]|uniref:uncharacterized protein LOC141533809 n=1 Tax=Cotesia typhae TaxID=2053667 RepID=UPI003D695235